MMSSTGGKNSQSIFPSMHGLHPMPHPSDSAYYDAFCALFTFPGSFTAYLGAGKVAPQTTLGPVQPSIPVAKHETQGVCTCVCFSRSTI